MWQNILFKRHGKRFKLYIVTENSLDLLESYNGIWYFNNTCKSFIFNKYISYNFIYIYYSFYIYLKYMNYEHYYNMIMYSTIYNKLIYKHTNNSK